MDNTLKQIADYASALRYADLPPEVVHQCKRIVVDTFGVALAAFDAEPSVIARRLAQRSGATPGAFVLGTAHRALPELAAFANGVMARYLDGNDAYPGGGGHPSDVIAPILAAADMEGADGKSVITAIVLAYEVFYSLWAATNLRHKGMDNVFYGTVGGAVGAAKVMGLDRERIAEAVSLSVVPNVALDTTRYGNVSMWKGCAAGNGARNAMFAALLAADGLTGPDMVFEGDHGLEKLAGPFKLEPFAGAGRPYRLCESTLKCHLSEGHSLSPISTALLLAPQVDVDDIEKITVNTYWFAWDVIGREPQKWRPVTREAADHSMPFVIASALLDRAFTDAAFTEERLRDPRIIRLMDKIVVREDKDITAQFPEKLRCRIEIDTRSSGRKVAENDYPRGHYRNPMNDDEVNEKFRGLAGRVLSGQATERGLAELWKLDTAASLQGIFEAVRLDKRG